MVCVLLVVYIGFYMRHPLPDFELVVKTYIEDAGVILNSTSYNRSTDKLSMTCNKGHNFSMTFITFKKGVRCAECCGLKKLTYKFVKSEIEKDGSILLSEEYKNAQTKLDIKCPKGHLYSMKWNHLKIGHRCRVCYFNNNVLENHPNFKTDRTRRRRSHMLSFNLDKIDILNDDLNYELYLEEKKKETKNIYDIDHIFPRMAFIDNNLDKIYDVKIIKEICNSKDNLRIVNNKENKSKYNKYNQEEFINWFNQKLEKYNETPKNNIE